MEQFFQIFTIVLTIILGLVIGSFLNVAIYRIPNNMSIANPPSHCPKCGKKIKWYENIPIFSYVFLRGKCSSCHGKISFRYPFVELLNTILYFLCLMMFTNYIFSSFEMNWLLFVVSCVVCSTLICIFFSDYDHNEIPEVFQVVLLICAVVLLMDHPTQETIMLKALGFVGAGAFFYISNLIFKLIRKRDGIGMGDVELVAFAGLLLGAYKIIYALILACFIGGIIFLILTLINKDRNKEYPFATMLTFFIAVAMFTGDFVVNWYLGLLGVK